VKYVLVEREVKKCNSGRNIGLWEGGVSSRKRELSQRNEGYSSIVTTFVKKEGKNLRGVSGAHQ